MLLALVLSTESCLSLSVTSHMGPELQNSFKEGSRDQPYGKLIVRQIEFRRNYRVSQKKVGLAFDGP